MCEPPKRGVRRELAIWLSVFAVAAVGAVATYVQCPGCVARTRVNTDCAWTGDVAFRLDPQDAAHRRHLVEDAQLAEELGIRYADTEFGRRAGTAHHGGLLEGGRVRNECLARLFQTIERQHGVTPGQVDAARGVRSPTYDAAVGTLFLPFYVLGAVLVCRRVTRRFSSDERAARTVAIGLGSVATALAGAQVFRLWGGVWEAIRVGNGHMTSIRAASANAWIHHHAGLDIVAGLLIFWLVALADGSFAVVASGSGRCRRGDRSDSLPDQRSHGV